MSESEEKIEREEKISSDGEIDTEKSPFLMKIGNFWYYHKWKVIIALFVVVLLSVTIAQCVRNAEADVSIMYAGSCYMVSTDFLAFRNAIADYLPSDVNGDGKFEADVAALNVFSEAQVNERIERSKTDSDVILINNYVNSNELQSFDNLVMAGEYSVMIVEPWLYSRVASSGGLRKLSDVFGTAPDGSLDEYAFPLVKTLLYEENSELFKNFTEDTVICFRTKGIVTGRKSANYETSEAVFKAIILGDKRN